MDAEKHRLCSRGSLCVNVYTGSGYNCPRTGNGPGVLQQVIGCAAVARPHHGIALGKKEWTTDAQTSRAEPRHTTPAPLRWRGVVRTAWHCNKERQTEQGRKRRTGPVSIWKSWYHEWKKPVLKVCTVWDSACRTFSKRQSHGEATWWFPEVGGGGRRGPQRISQGPFGVMELFCILVVAAQIRTSVKICRLTDLLLII